MFMIAFVPETPTYAEVLRRLRDKLRMSQAEMAALIGTNRSTYKNWEYGAAEPPRDAAKKIDALSTGAPLVVKESVTQHYSQDLGRPLIPVGFPAVPLRYAGTVPTSEEWGDPLSSEEFIEVDPKFEHPKRFAAKVVGRSCWPALQQGDITIWHSDNDPPFGRIVLAQRKGDHGCTVKQLVWDDEAQRPLLQAINPEFQSPPDGDGWGVIARLVAVIRSFDGPEQTWYYPQGLTADHLKS